MTSHMKTICFDRIIHYPEDEQYTIRPLEVTNLAGRDPITGRVVILP